MITTLIATSIVDSNIYTEFGRKPVMIQGAIGMTLCMILLGICTRYDLSPYLQLAIILVFIAFFESSLGPLLFIYMGEIMTDKGISIALGVSWIGGSLIGGVYPSFSNAIGMENTFYFFGGCCGVLLVFLIFVCIETKGLTFDEAQRILLNKSKRAVSLDA